MGRLKVGVRSFLLLFGDFSKIGYLTNFHINLFSDKKISDHAFACV